MRAINHAMTGAIIGLSLANPVALPLAVVSHYALDSLPHYNQKKQLSYGSRLFKLMLLIDIMLCFGLVVVLALKHPGDWWLAGICAFAAASPDFMWLGDFIDVLKGRPLKKHSNQLVVLHSWVQWFQRPIGIIVELAWAVLSLAILGYLLAR